MNGKKIKQALRMWMLPIAMAGGCLFHNYIGYLSWISPYLIFVMLFLTYCRLQPREFRLSPLSLLLLCCQIGGGVALYYVLLPVNDLLAQGAFICVFCPTATAAPVITGMLGGSITRVAAFSLAGNISVAILAPLLFSLFGHSEGAVDTTWTEATALISLKVIPLILGPLLLALLVEWMWPTAHKKIADHQGISFYVWAVTLFIVVGNAVSYVLRHLTSTPEEATTMLQLALVSLVVCCAQFYFGRKIGRIYGDKVAGAQGLGQKNTVLAIWMALTFLNPLSSVAPAAYVAWQNTINSLQIWYKARRETQTA